MGHGRFRASAEARSPEPRRYRVRCPWLPARTTGLDSRRPMPGAAVGADSQALRSGPLLTSQSQPVIDAAVTLDHRWADVGVSDELPPAPEFRADRRRKRGPVVDVPSRQARAKSDRRTSLFHRPEPGRYRLAWSSAGSTMGKPSSMFREPASGRNGRTALPPRDLMHHSHALTTYDREKPRPPGKRHPGATGWTQHVTHWTTYDQSPGDHGPPANTLLPSRDFGHSTSPTDHIRPKSRRPRPTPRKARPGPSRDFWDTARLPLTAYDQSPGDHGPPANTSPLP